MSALQDLLSRPPQPSPGQMLFPSLYGGGASPAAQQAQTMPQPQQQIPQQPGQLNIAGAQSSQFPALAHLIQQGQLDGSQINMNPNITVGAPQAGSPLNQLLATKLLPTVGSIGGGILGTFAGGLPGGIAGAGAGGSVGELIRREGMRLMGEDPNDPGNKNPNITDSGVLGDLMSSAKEGATDAAFELAGGALAPLAGKVAKFGAETLGVTEDQLTRRALGLTKSGWSDVNAKIEAMGAKSIPEYVQSKGYLTLGGPGPIKDQIEKDLADIGSKAEQEYRTNGGDIPVGDVQAKLNDMKTQLRIDPSNPKSAIRPNGTSAAAHIDEIGKMVANTYGDSVPAYKLEQLKTSLYNDFGVDGAYAKNSQLQKNIPYVFKGLLDTASPTAKAFNQEYSTLKTLQTAMANADAPGLSLAGTFGSSLPTSIATHAGGPLAGLLTFTGAQSLKNPAFAGKVSSALMSVSQLGDTANPLLKQFYSVAQPAMSQLAGKSLTESGSNQTTSGGSVDYQAAADKANAIDVSAIPDASKQSAALGAVMPTADSMGYTQNIPGGEYISKSSLDPTQAPPYFAQQGQVGPDSNFMTKEQAAMAMIADPKQASVIKQVYDLLKDPSQSMTVDEKKSYSSLATLQGVVNQAKQLYSQAGGPQGRIGGQLANITANAGSNPNLRVYNSFREGALAIMARGWAGDVGRLTNFDMQKVDNLLPQVTDTPDELRAKMAMLDAGMNQRWQTFKTTSTIGNDAGAASSDATGSSSDTTSTDYAGN